MTECEPCKASAVIGMALKICYEYGDKNKCKSIYSSLTKGDIKTVEQLIEEVRKIINEGHELLDEVKAYYEESVKNAAED
ncbi:MAG: hypothetical protein ABIM44_04945 [candidate division WOR-3 bacterium]